MQLICIILFLITLTSIKIIYSYNPNENDDDDEDKFNKIRQISLLNYYSIFPLKKQLNPRQCISKHPIIKYLNRQRKASISRLHYHQQPHIHKPLPKRFIDDFDNFLEEKNIQIVYEDSNKICLSKSIDNTLLQEFIDKIKMIKQNQTEQMQMENLGRKTIGKHPALYRYRVG